MKNILLSIPIMSIWIIIAKTHGHVYPFWVWIINGFISRICVDGIRFIVKEIKDEL
jgi:hypothetical protein